ncbi:MAG: cold shock domain-containing protein [Legionellaceae bacterium]|nr:cold shock domain-containing protein [Legionellaceae bacterium]
MNIITRIIRRCFSSSKNGKQQGTIKFFDRKKRFGFIVAGQKEYFFHASAAKPEDVKGLRDGAKVYFVLIEGKKGPQADSIEIA